DVPIDRDEEEDNDHPSGDSPPSTSKSAKAKAKKSNSEHGTRLPDDWKPDQDGIDFAVKRLGSLEDTREVFGDFRRHWLSKPDPGAHKVRWDLVWESWVEEAVRRRGKGAKGRKVTGMQALREYCGERDYRPGGKISAQQGIREYFGEVYESGSERGNIIEGELVDKQKDNLFKFGS
ncbi:MAG: hypothetical protein KDK08_28335, partial [Rhizobiaceae bacterium]|nr:hypothetical protein [Rhizobiaceae bacterium]